MPEAIHCPSCTTRYRLRAERLTPAIRRAKCLSCGGIFPVGDLVQRLLAAGPVAEPSQAPIAGTASFSTQDLDAARALSLGADAPSYAQSADAPSLTLGDLEGVDAEILEKTLIDTPATLPEAKPEAKAVAAPAPAPESAPLSAFPPEITESTLSGYTSARDAIEKLFGAAPAQGGLKVNQDADAMDMEATLHALESTLGGVPVPTPPSVPATAPGDGPTDAGHVRDVLAEMDQADPTTSTMRLTQDDLAAVLAATPKAAPKPAEPTVALRASDLLAAHEEKPVPASRPFASEPDQPEGGAELLRLKVGEDVYGNLTMPQLIAWVGEGRILETHLVARQHSENWLEAHKVPGLRPVFERLRR
ncbi:MAG TPA: zinc-ribbon domain-containing protein, partial [Geothrix sp.]|nr:zinc-ribbon domain-containing protein [Geothrix sp.]